MLTTEVWCVWLLFSSPRGAVTRSDAAGKR